MNETIRSLTSHRSIRKYKEESPTEEMLHQIVNAGQRAAFAVQCYSVILDREQKRNPFRAPWFFLVCIDLHRMERIMEKRGWKIGSSDAYALMLAGQDAAYAAQNMIVAAESLGLGTCYLGWVPLRAEHFVQKYQLPLRVFPLVGITMGVPDENPPLRPRYPASLTLFENRYPQLGDSDINQAMRVMDEGYLEQDYYRKAKFMVPLDDGKEETYTFDDYSWTEHISRKLGLWCRDPQELLDQLRKCGFDVCQSRD